MRIKGISGSRGIAVGNVYKYIQEEIVIPDYIVPEGGVDQEIAKFAGAMAATLKQLDNIRKKTLDEMGPEEAAIFEAHMQIAQDPSLSDGIKALVEFAVNNRAAGTVNLQCGNALVRQRRLTARRNLVTDSGNLVATEFALI